MSHHGVEFPRRYVRWNLTLSDVASWVDYWGQDVAVYECLLRLEVVQLLYHPCTKNFQKTRPLHLVQRHRFCEKDHDQWKEYTLAMRTRSKLNKQSTRLRHASHTYITSVLSRFDTCLFRPFRFLVSCWRICSTVSLVNFASSSSRISIWALLPSEECLSAGIKLNVLTCVPNITGSITSSSICLMLVWTLDGDAKGGYDDPRLFTQIRSCIPVDDVFCSSCWQLCYTYLSTNNPLYLSYVYESRQLVPLDTVLTETQARQQLLLLQSACLLRHKNDVTKLTHAFSSYTYCFKSLQTT